MADVTEQAKLRRDTVSLPVSSTAAEAKRPDITAFGRVQYAINVY